MQKVVGSSPIIRSKKSCKGACRVVCAVNDLLSVASYRVAEQTEITWARDTAAALLGPPGRCWAHTLGASRGRLCSDVLPAPGLDVLEGGAYLDEIGYEDATA